MTTLNITFNGLSADSRWSWTARQRRGRPPHRGGGRALRRRAAACSCSHLRGGRLRATTSWTASGARSGGERIYLRPKVPFGALRGVRAPMRIVFCGVGAMGSTAAVLCRNLDATLVFIDFDRVESKNLLVAGLREAVRGEEQGGGAEAPAPQPARREGGGLRRAAHARQRGDALRRARTCWWTASTTRTAARCSVTSRGRRASRWCTAAVSGDGTFGLVRWDERFVPDAEDAAGQATCEGGEHLPLIGLLARRARPRRCRTSEARREAGRLRASTAVTPVAS